MGVSRLRLAAAAILALAATGCQSYRAEPFDAEQFGRAWRARGAVESPPATRSPLPATRPAAPFDLRDGVTLAEAQAVALLYNPALRVARLKAGVAGATAANAGRWADPTLGVDVERIVSGVKEPWVVGGTINLTLPISGRLEAERKRATAEHAVTLLRVAGQEWSLRHGLRLTWAEWSTQAARAELLDALVGRLAEIDRVTDRLAQAGSLTRVEARLFRIELATRRAEQIAARARLDELRLEIHATLGMVPDAGVALTPAMPTDLTEVDERQLIARNFDIRAAAAGYEVAERTLEREVRAQYPDLAIGPGFGTDEGDERVLFGLSLPLPLWNRNRQGVAEAAAGRDLARAELETTIELQTSALAAARVRRDAAIRQRDLYQSAIAPVADEHVAEVDRLAGLGEVNAVLQLDAYVRQHQAKVAALDAQLAVIRADARLAEIAGDAAATPSSIGPGAQ